jgi:hypothetical protein
MLHLLRNFVKDCQKQLRTHPHIVWLNGLTVLLFAVLTLYVKLWSDGLVVERLFSSPYDQEFPYFGMLTTASNLLLCFAASSSSFSAMLLRELHPQRKLNGFVAGFALILTVIVVDRALRLTVILSSFGRVLKLLMFLIYGASALWWAFKFRHKLAATPYAMLLGAIGLLVFAAVVDLVSLQGHGRPAMLEEGSTLLATVNIALYIWLVCRKEVLKVLPRQPH